MIEFLAEHVIFTLVMCVILYVIQALLISELNRLIYGRGNWLAWVPGFNVYLLGKLTLGPTVGLLLVIAMVLGGTYTTTVNGVKITKPLLPEEISTPIFTFYCVAMVVVFVLAIIKFIKLAQKGETQINKSFYPKYENFSNPNATSMPINPNQQSNNSQQDKFFNE